ncbi:peptide chain release factor N(5)-glutamine methyltransferase, partial [Treponema sp. OttesenSCG-928-L16]|nr:peptide chain release factor N(5)-glutamine methyltransferase [Treponema sp. OttesenSCG-928-L16]
MTKGAALREGTRLLRLSGIETPSLDASLFLAEVLGTDRTRLFMAGSDPLETSFADQFFSLIKRRQEGESAAYILGRKEFRHITLSVGPDVLVPRPDTEILVEAALEAIDCYIEQGTAAPALLDLCTGSGAVAIALKDERPGAELSASDISPQALDTARRNSDRILGRGMVSFFESDLFDAIPGMYHIIVSNPPYIPSSMMTALPPEVLKEPPLALDGGGDGLDIIRRIVSAAPEKLLPSGRLFLEADPRQMGNIWELL